MITRPPPRCRSLICITEGDTNPYGCTSASTTGGGHENKPGLLDGGGTGAFGCAKTAAPPVLVASGGGGGDGGGDDDGRAAQAQAEAAAIANFQLRGKEPLLGKGKRRRVSADTADPPEAVDWFDRLGDEIEEREGEVADGDITTIPTIPTAIPTTAAAAAAAGSAVTDVASSSGLTESAEGSVGVIAGVGSDVDGDIEGNGPPEVSGITIVVAVKRSDNLRNPAHQATAALGSEVDMDGVGSGGLEMGVVPCFEAAATPGEKE